MADVRREKELAERRKNEPQLDQNQDHLVRKIFSKFRRDRAALTPQLSQSASPQDPEKGEASPAPEKEDQAAVVVPVARRPGKWGRLLGSSLDSGSESSSGRAQNGGNKVFPKAGRVAGRQDTIEEAEEPRLLRKVESADSGVQFRAAPPEYKEIMTNIMEFKVDVKLEVQKLNQKVGRMEEMLSELLSRLGSASPSSASGAEARADGSKPPVKRRSKSRGKAPAPGVPQRSSPSDPEPPPSQDGPRRPRDFL